MSIRSLCAFRFLGALAFVTFASAAAIASPQLLSNQGYLADSDGEPLTGTHTLTFSMYSEPDAVNPPVWTEEISVDFVDGTYAVVLGRTSTIDAALLALDPLYFGLSVDDGPLMEPLHELTSVPYAIVADTATNVLGGEVDATSLSVGGDVVVDGDRNLDVASIAVDGTPLFDGSGAFVGTPPPLPDLGCTDGQLVVWVAARSSWECIDDAFASSPAATIESSWIAEWTEAFGWGDHGEAGYVQFDPSDPLTVTLSQSQVDAWNAAAAGSESDPVFSSSAAGEITSDDVAGWEAMYGDWLVNVADWGAAEIDPVFSTSPAGGITSDDVAGWEAMYGSWFANVADWGAAESDPVFTASAAGEITSDDVARWEAMYASWFANFADWGAAESDPVFTASPARDVTEIDLLAWRSVYSDWNANNAEWSAAFAWGDHSMEGYLRGDPTDSPTGPVSATDIAEWHAVYDDWNSNSALWDNAAAQIVNFSGDWNLAADAWFGSGADWDAVVDLWGTDGVIDFALTVAGFDAQIEFSGTPTGTPEWAIRAIGEDLEIVEADQDDKRYVLINDDSGIVFYAGSTGESYVRITNTGDVQMTGHLGCPSGTTRVGAYCISGMRGPAQHSAAMTDCIESTLTLCSSDALFACDHLDPAGTDCASETDNTSQNPVWTDRVELDGQRVDDITGFAQTYSGTGSTTVNQLDYASRAESHEYFCCVMAR